MDPPKHDEQRKTVQGVVAPQNLKELEVTIRSRAGDILDDLPLNKTFDWVDKVSIELTTQMLATLFDFPYHDRRKLTRWSDVVFARLGEGIIESNEQRQNELLECLEYFSKLWKEREKDPTGNDFVSMMIRGDATRNLSPQEYLGNILLFSKIGPITRKSTASASSQKNTACGFPILTQQHSVKGASSNLTCNVSADLIRGISSQLVFTVPILTETSLSPILWQ